MALHCGDAVKSLLVTYNNVIQLLSQKFIYWDSLLTKWETILQQYKQNVEQQTNNG